MDITRYDSVQLSKDDDRYQEKLDVLNEAGFWFDPVEDRWIKPEPLEDEDVRLQFFGAERVHPLTASSLASGKCCSSYWRTALNTTNPATAGSGRKTRTATAEPVLSSTPPGISIPVLGRESPAIYF